MKKISSSLSLSHALIIIIIIIFFFFFFSPRCRSCINYTSTMTIPPRRAAMPTPTAAITPTTHRGDSRASHSRSRRCRRRSSGLSQLRHSGHEQRAQRGLARGLRRPRSQREGQALGEAIQVLCHGECESASGSV